MADGRAGAQRCQIGRATSGGLPGSIMFPRPELFYPEGTREPVADLLKWVVVKIQFGALRTQGSPCSVN